jgi:hypothetical protein
MPDADNSNLVSSSPAHRRRFAVPRFVCHSGLFLALCLLLSCGKGREPVYAVRGKVLCNGQPAVHAFVIFHPVGGSEVVQRMRPYGTVGPDGTFALNTYRDGDGAPLGEYAVTIEWPSADPWNPPDPGDPESAPTGPDRLRGRYANPDTSGLRATVTEGENELEPFEIR